MMKLCKLCQNNKDILFFPKKGKYSSGATRYGSICKDCHARQEIERYRNIEDKTIYNSVRYQNSLSKLNSEQQKLYNNKKTKKYRENLKNDAVAWSLHLENRRKNRNKIKTKEYDSRPYVKQKKNISTAKYHKNKYNSDPVYKSRIIISSQIRQALAKNSSSKNHNSILNYIPYTIEELKQHLECQFEPWMNWNNHGKYNSKTWNNDDSLTWTWNIDHIIPQSDLPYASMDDDNFKKCWSLDNLRPLSAKQNIIDGPSRIRHKKAA